jgi:hypothetical protein
MSHPPYILDLFHSDLSLLWPLNVKPGGQKFQTDGELRRGDLN